MRSERLVLSAMRCNEEEEEVTKEIRGEGEKNQIIEGRFGCLWAEGGVIRKGISVQIRASNPTKVSKIGDYTENGDKKKKKNNVNKCQSRTHA